LHAVLLRDRQDLVRQIRLAHVKEALPGHRAVLHALLFRHKAEHRVHQRRLARGARKDWITTASGAFKLARDR
jgi:hypothetical protein